jgi:hypothetical protein
VEVVNIAAASIGFHPSHFRSIIRGTTATGRATIDALQLNRERVVNLRGVLLVTGDHPPD